MHFLILAVFFQQSIDIYGGGISDRIRKRTWRDFGGSMTGSEEEVWQNFGKILTRFHGSFLRFPGGFISIFLRGFFKTLKKTWRPLILGTLLDGSGGALTGMLWGISPHLKRTWGRRPRTTNGSCPGTKRACAIPAGTRRGGGAGPRAHAASKPRPSCALLPTQAHVGERRALVWSVTCNSEAARARGCWGATPDSRSGRVRVG